MIEKTATAHLKAIKSSPLKVMRVTKTVSGMKVSDAIKFLQFSKLKVSEAVLLLVKSAVANAENNHNMDADNLFVKSINVGRAFALKRFATRGRGKSSRILKTFSNISIVLSETNMLPSKEGDKSINNKKTVNKQTKAE